MSQLIVCKNKHGIILAADSKAIDFDTAGNLTEIEVPRLIQLTQYTAILTGGAPEGEKMCLVLKQFITQEDLKDIDEVYAAALRFLATEHERFMRKHCEILPLDPLHHLCFILAGYSHKEEQNPYRLFLIWTKKKLPQLDGDEISTAFSIPRNIRLEYNLNRLCQDNAPLEKVFPEIQKTMERLSSAQPDEVGGPFSYAFITEQGYRKIG